MLDDGFAECATVLAVGHRGLQGGAGDPERLGRDADATAVESAHRHLEAIALPAEAQLRRHAALVEKDLASARAGDAELPLGGSAPHARQVHGKDERG